jgi:membrane-bound lytic murein transglycosylase B
MLRQHADLFRRIEARYGVPGAVLVAFWGLETDFGTDLGKYRRPARSPRSPTTAVAPRCSAPS